MQFVDVVNVPEPMALPPVAGAVVAPLLARGVVALEAARLEDKAVFLGPAALLVRADFAEDVATFAEDDAPAERVADPMRAVGTVLVLNEYVYP